MTDRPITATDLDGLVRRCEGAANAFIRGDTAGYLALIKHGDDYVLTPPFGGPAWRGFDRSDAAAAARRDFFSGGEAAVEVVATYASGDLAVLVIVERQHGRVGGLPDQDWSLRVTLVFRREQDDWLLVHRHADPLSHEIPFAQAAGLAAGAGTGPS